MSGTPTKLNPDVPPAPQPLYPDTPWWAILIAVLVTAVISVVGTVVAFRGAEGVSGGLDTLSGVSVLVDTVTYTPHIILLFGVLADMFTYSGVYSIPSLIGVLSIFANYVFRYFWVGLNSLLDRGTKLVTETPPVGGKKQKGGGVGKYFTNYDGCNVQGFEGLGSRFAPQTLVVTATVFSYYIFDLVKNRGWLNSVAALVIGPLLFIAQAMIIGNCSPDAAAAPEEAAASDQPSAFGKAIRALAEGLLFGGTSYAIVQTYYPNRLPSSVISPFPTISKDELSPGPDGKLYDKNGYPWVVMPNGQTLPDISSARARKAFAAVASVNLGTGRPAEQSCSS